MKGLRSISWLDKLPKELKIYISQLNFDALAWFMLTDDAIYTHYTNPPNDKHRQIFYDLFLEHEACTELVLPLFKKIHNTAFAETNGLTSRMKSIDIIEPDPNNYVCRYRLIDKNTYSNLYKYRVTGNTQTWSKFYISQYVIHRDNALDGKPLPAYTTSNGEYYYNNGKQFYPNDSELII